MDTQLNLIDLPAGPEAPGSDASTGDGPQLTRRAKQANRGTPRRDRANSPAADLDEPPVRTRHKAPRPRTPKADSPFRLPETVRATGRQGIASARQALADARHRPDPDAGAVDHQRPSAA